MGSEDGDNRKPGPTCAVLHREHLFSNLKSRGLGLNRHWGLAFAMRRWDVERVDLAALGKCGSRIGLVSARASSACEVPMELAGGPNFKQAAILVTAVGPGDYLGLSVC